MATPLRRIALAASLLSLGVYATWQSDPDSNAVDGCGLVCVDNGPFKCLGTFATAALCLSACQAASGCSIATWSGSSQHCWTRTDGQWAPDVAPGDASFCNDAKVAACGPPPPPPPPTTSLSVFVNSTAAVGARTHPLSPAVTLDFWLSTDPTYGVKWGNASALTLDLQQPSLLALASALGPGLLRIGGSPEDSVIFDADGTCVPGSGGDGPAPGGYYCSQVRPYSYACLTPARWEALLAFGAATGLRVVLGLNGCYGRMAANASMDLSNARALLEATAASPHVGALYGFELTNEVVPNTISPAAWGADVAALHALLVAVFGGAGLPVPPVLGPDQGGAAPMAAVAAATPAGALAGLTYHQYPQCAEPVPGPPSYVLAPACLGQLDTMAAAGGAVGRQYALPVWAGETADHSGGGVPGLTDTFRSSFYYAWQLGALPPLGVELAARQCLVGGDYELVRRDTFTPNPDFFVAWLFRHLVGGGAAAYAVNASAPWASSGVRVFAFDAAPATRARLALLVVNLQTAAEGVNVTLGGGGGAAGGARTEWHLTGDPAAPHGTVACNGVPLVQGAGGQLPPWLPLGVPGAAGTALAVAPASIVFVTVAP